MYVTATRAEVQSIITAIGAATPVYALTAGNVTQCAFGVGGGWLGVLISGVYSEANFLSDCGGSATKVSAVVLS